MKKYAIDIYIIIGIILLVCIMILATLSIVYGYNNIENNDETQPTISQIKLLDRHITNDNKYEILYSITYTNGITLQVWKEVNFNDYIELWEENKYDENSFIN